MIRLASIRCAARTVLAALTIAGACAATPAAAAFGCPGSPCILDPGSGPIFYDFTVPPDGRQYRWTIAFTSPDPAATVSLDGPNQTEVFTETRDGSGFYYDGNPPYRFDETISPGLTTILVRAPREFDFCDQPGPGDQICSAVVHIWGNGTFLQVNGTAPLYARFSETVVPEPASWLLLTGGFALAGARLRRYRPTRSISASAAAGARTFAPEMKKT